MEGGAYTVGAGRNKRPDLSVSHLGGYERGGEVEGRRGKDHTYIDMIRASGHVWCVIGVCIGVCVYRGMCV